jgi:hypothetical protein
MVPGTGLEPASQLRRRIFVTLLLSKPASRVRTVRALDYAFAIAHGRACCPCALGAPRLVSTPSSRMPRGLARRCLDARIRGFAEFEGFCTDRFRSGTQSFKSAMFTNFITPARGRTGFYHCPAGSSAFDPVTPQSPTPDFTVAVPAAHASCRVASAIESQSHDARWMPAKSMPPFGTRHFSRITNIFDFA